MIYTGMLGLIGIYERAKLMDDSFQGKSQPGEVTRITVRLPGHIFGE
jgi:signal transduction histidine kinase